VAAERFADGELDTDALAAAGPDAHKAAEQLVRPQA
jgi:hypothetical protein